MKHCFVSILRNASGDCTTSGSDPNYPKFTGLEVNVPIPIHDRYETQEEYDILSQ